MFNVIIKKLVLSFTQFQTWVHNADHLLYYPQMSLFLFHPFFGLLYQFLLNGNRNNVNLSYSYNWQKFNDRMNEKRRQEYQSMDPEYVTRQINSRILELLLRRFNFCNVSKILIRSWNIFTTTTKDTLAVYNCRYWLEWLL